jgi:hypothetical protein
MIQFDFLFLFTQSEGEKGGKDDNLHLGFKHLGLTNIAPNV